MFIRIATPGIDLSQEEADGIGQDLVKVDRRLEHMDDVSLEVRIQQPHGRPVTEANLALEYGRNHLIAKAEAEDMRLAVRAAREELLRQINDRRDGRSHSSYQKHS